MQTSTGESKVEMVILFSISNNCPNLKFTPFLRVTDIADVAATGTVNSNRGMRHLCNMTVRPPTAMLMITATTTVRYHSNGDGNGNGNSEQYGNCEQ